MEGGFSKNGVGMILGKFLPPHRGHQYLIDFGLNYVEHLIVIVGTLKSEPIPGKIRFEWMREAFPRADVRHLEDENPQEPQEHPDFWEIWRDSLRGIMPTGPDFVFASEEYGFKLAEILGARYIPVDHARELVPISGTQIRENPMANWTYILPSARPYFVRKVCIFGPESTGKSILAQRLATHYRTVHVHEYARGMLSLKNNQVDPDDFPLIARGQAAAEDALALQANRVLFCDTDLLTTCIWSNVFDGVCPTWMREEAERRDYDLYLLMDIDSPWVDDPQRFLPDERESFLVRCENELSRLNRKYIKIGGTWDERFQRACQEVDRLLGVQ